MLIKTKSKFCCDFFAVHFDAQGLGQNQNMEIREELILNHFKLEVICKFVSILGVHVCIRKGKYFFGK